MPDNRIAFEIKEHLGVIQTMKSGWKKELNIVAWNGNAPKYDIREWDEHHEKMSKGITLTPWEMQKITDMYLKNNTDKAVAKGRAIEEERRMRMELDRSERRKPMQAAGEPFSEARRYEDMVPCAEETPFDEVAPPSEATRLDGVTQSAEREVAGDLAAEDGIKAQVAQVAEETSLDYNEEETACDSTPF